MAARAAGFGSGKVPNFKPVASLRRHRACGDLAGPIAISQAAFDAIAATLPLCRRVFRHGLVWWGLCSDKKGERTFHLTLALALTAAAVAGLRNR